MTKMILGISRDLIWMSIFQLKSFVEMKWLVQLPYRAALTALEVNKRDFHWLTEKTVESGERDEKFVKLWNQLNSNSEFSRVFIVLVSISAEYLWWWSGATYKNHEAISIWIFFPFKLSCKFLQITMRKREREREMKKIYKFHQFWVQSIRAMPEASSQKTHKSSNFFFSWKLSLFHFDKLKTFISSAFENCAHFHRANSLFSAIRNFHPLNQTDNWVSMSMINEIFCKSKYQFISPVRALNRRQLVSQPYHDVFAVRSFAQKNFLSSLLFSQKWETTEHWSFAGILNDKSSNRLGKVLEIVWISKVSTRRSLYSLSGGSEHTVPPACNNEVHDCFSQEIVDINSTEQCSMAHRRRDEWHWQRKNVQNIHLAKTPLNVTMTRLWKGERKNFKIFQEILSLKAFGCFTLARQRRHEQNFFCRVEAWNVEKIKPLKSVAALLSSSCFVFALFYFHSSIFS